MKLGILSVPFGMLQGMVEETKISEGTNSECPTAPQSNVYKDK